MKEIIAYIKPHKIPAVTVELKKVDGFPGMSVGEVLGFGAAKIKYEEDNFEEALTEYEPHSKLEIICEDHQVDLIIDVIQKASYTGLRGDGNIYVSEVQKSIRISKGGTG